MKTRIPVICIVVMSMVILIPQASACSCAAEWNIEDDFVAKDNVIFSGKVTDIKEQQRTFLVTFEMYESWKGIPYGTETMEIMTAQSSSSCGVFFEEEKSYLVVAHGEWNEIPNVSSCGSTTNLDFAHEQISFLNKIPESLFVVQSVEFMQDVIYPDELGFYEVEITDADGNPVELFVTGRVDYEAPWGPSNFSPVGNYDKEKQRFVGELTAPREITPGNYTLKLDVHGWHDGPFAFSGIKQVEFVIGERPGSMETLFLPSSLDSIRRDYRFYHMDEPRIIELQLVKGHYYSPILANHSASILVYGIDNEHNRVMLEAFQGTSDSNGMIRQELFLDDRNYCEYDVVIKSEYNGFEHAEEIDYRMTNIESFYFTWEDEKIPVTIEGRCSVPLSMSFSQPDKTMTVEVDTTDAKKQFEIHFPHRLLDGDLTVLVNGEIDEDIGSVEKRRDEAIVNVGTTTDFTTVEIIGTSAIPEFEAFAAMILTISILPIILLNRNRK